VSSREGITTATYLYIVYECKIVIVYDSTEVFYTLYVHGCAFKCTLIVCVTGEPLLTVHVHFYTFFLHICEPESEYLEKFFLSTTI